jgi:hypothetical protein
MLGAKSAARASARASMVFMPAGRAFAVSLAPRKPPKLDAAPFGCRQRGFGAVGYHLGLTLGDRRGAPRFRRCAWAAERTSGCARRGGQIHLSEEIIVTLPHAV